MEREYVRTVAHRLAVLRHAEEVSRNVSLTCRYYTRTCFYRWKRGYAQLGESRLRDRSSRPRRSPRATSADVVGKIVYLRQHYHVGPLKIAMYLERYQDISLSQSGIWRILRRLQTDARRHGARHPAEHLLLTGWLAVGQPPAGKDGLAVEETDQPHVDFLDAVERAESESQVIAVSHLMKATQDHLARRYVMMTKGHYMSGAYSDFDVPLAVAAP